MFFGFAFYAHASNVYIETNKNQIYNGSLVEAYLYMDTNGETVNALEGELSYDKNHFVLKNINLGGSFVSFWVDKPKDENGKIHFSGIVPGGLSVSKSEIFHIVLQAKQPGASMVGIANAKLLLNDGLGSEKSVEPSNVLVDISKTYKVEEFSISDVRVPEEFKIERVKDISLFEGQWFVVFGTQDKGSNVSHYVVCELWSNCKEATSPYLLQQQNVFYRIKVYAYDSAGNAQSATLTSPVLMIGVLLLSFVIVLIIYKKFRRYFRKNRV